MQNKFIKLIHRRKKEGNELFYVIPIFLQEMKRTYVIRVVIIKKSVNWCKPQDVQILKKVKKTFILTFFKPRRRVKSFIMQNHLKQKFWIKTQVKSKMVQGDVIHWLGYYSPNFTIAKYEIDTSNFLENSFMHILWEDQHDCWPLLKKKWNLVGFTFYCYLHLILTCYENDYYFHVWFLN